MNSIKILTVLCSLVILVASCKYEEVADASYPDQSIYFPAAVNGHYVVNDISTPGMPYRYVADLSNRKLNIPLAVYRSGVNNTGGFKIDIAIDNNTITDLIANGGLAAGSILLPKNQYEVATAIDMADGKELAPFTLSVNIDYLLNNPDHPFAICLQTSSSKVTANPSLAKVIVVIDPAILHPKAGFNKSTDENNARIIHFSNTSKYALAYSWDFGDGLKSQDTSPSHTYKTSGTYTIKLTAIGIVGEAGQNIYTQNITVP